MVESLSKSCLLELVVALLRKSMEPNQEATI